jgi:hypothetical protein
VTGSLCFIKFFDLQSNQSSGPFFRKKTKPPKQSDRNLRYTINGLFENNKTLFENNKTLLQNVEDLNADRLENISQWTQKEIAWVEEIAELKKQKVIVIKS